MKKISFWHIIIFVAMLSPTFLVRFSLMHHIPTTLFEILIWLLVCVTCVRAYMYAPVRAMYLKKMHALPLAFLCATILFFIAGIISVFVAPNFFAALGIFKAYIVDAILFGIVVWLHLEHEDQVWELAAGLSITLFVISVWAVVQKFTGWGIPNLFWRVAATRRVTSIFGYPNAVGLYAELVVPFVCAWAWHVWHTKNTHNSVALGVNRKKMVYAWCAVVLLCASAAIVFAQSSGTIAALGGTAILFLLYARRTRRAALIIGIIATTVLFASPLRKPFADEFLLQGFSGMLRVQMWKETVVMLRQRPIVGAGLAGYQSRVKPFHVFKWAEIYLYPHNLFLTLWSELGALGVVSFVWIFFMLVQFSWRARSKNVGHALILATCSIIFIHGLVDIPYFKNDLSALFWMIVAIAMWLRYTMPTSHDV